MSPYRDPQDVVKEIVDWLRACARNTKNQSGVGKAEDPNTVAARVGFGTADEIEKRWGAVGR